MKRQSLSLCWDIQKHDVPLVDTTCTDQDEDEERDVVHHELHQPLSDASWTSEDETRHVSSVFLAECQVYTTRLCRLSISGWLSQAVKSTDTNSRKIACGTLDTSQKLACFLKTATCRSIHLRCGRISVLQIAIKPFKKFWVICRSTSCVCSVIQLIITVISVLEPPLSKPDSQWV